MDFPCHRGRWDLGSEIGNKAYDAKEEVENCIVELCGFNPSVTPDVGRPEEDAFVAQFVAMFGEWML